MVYHGISHKSLVFSSVYTKKIQVTSCHRKHSRKHNQYDIRVDFILNGFELDTYCHDNVFKTLKLFIKKIHDLLFIKKIHD